MCDRPVSGSRKAWKPENSAYIVILTLGEPVAFPGKTVSRSDEVAERIEVVRNIGKPILQKDSWPILPHYTRFFPRGALIY